MVRGVPPLNGVQEVGSSNLPGPTNFPPVGDHFPVLTIALHGDGMRHCPPNPRRLLIMCLFSDGLVPPGSSIPLARTRQEATGVPTRTVDDPHCPSRVLAELAVVTIADFVSEFRQLSPGWRTRLRRGGIAAVAQSEP